VSRFEVSRRIRRYDYVSAGVDQERKDRAIEESAALIATTYGAGVIPNPGGFAGLYAPGRYVDPVLVATTDGVGTKLKLANLLGKHDTVGIDLVAMSVNDLIVEGADPLFFLDYIAMGRIDPQKVKVIISGIVEGCRIAACALLGGETAEMPGMYAADEYDLVGFALGAVERDRIVRGTKIVPGDAIIGIASSGVHSNGYSLVRKIFVEAKAMPLDARPPQLEGRTLGEVLMEPTTIYAGAIRSLIGRFRPEDEVKGIAHVTGAGIPGNLPRVLPEGVGARIRVGSWPVPPVFEIIQSAGRVEEAEMFRVFNMGIGMILIAPHALAAEMVEHLGREGLRAHVIGTTIEGPREVEFLRPPST